MKFQDMHTKPLYKIVLSAVLLLSISPVFAQRIGYSANSMEYDKRIGPNVQRLIGNVVFREKSANMYCDSAYFYEKNEDIDAFGRVRIVPHKGHTSLSGKMLHYSADSRQAIISGGVTLVDDNTTLVTDMIIYNMITGIADYNTQGIITSDKNKLVSQQGSYNKDLKQFYFKHKVVVTNPQYVIHTDTMNYNTESKVVDFLGPTTIVSNDKDSIYCERGWYNTATDISSFQRKAWLKGSGKIIKGDTLYYEKRSSLGKVFGNAQMRDTTQNIILRGNFASYDRIRQKALITKKALMIQVDKKDSLYLHADTIYSGIFTEKNETLARVDTFKYVKAYHRVKFFRTDLQGKCDSLYYSFKDSTLQFINDPVLWNNGTQLKAEHVTIFTKNQKMERMEMTNAGFIISQEDSIRFNQIKGRDMTGYFNKDNELYKMLVKGNGQTIYFAKDQGSLVGVQKAESSDIILFFKQRKLDRLTYLSQVNGAFHPPFELSGFDLQLKDFIWLDHLRPRSWRDVFIWK
ncbi:MAG: OstA-like protein [Bacteroidota bacterium]|nr:OstA-like protein [Bacteroidota bacterium]